MITIQPADTSHIPVIQQIAQTTWPITFGAILSKEQLAYMMEMMYSSSSLSRQMSVQKHLFLLASNTHKNLGFAAFELAYHGGEKTKIHKLYLLPEAQGQGLGSTFLQQISEKALQNGQQAITLNVNKYNEPAIKFYKKMGFRITREEVIPIGEGYIMDDYVLEKSLAPIPSGS